MIRSSRGAVGSNQPKNILEDGKWSSTKTTRPFPMADEASSTLLCLQKLYLCESEFEEGTIELRMRRYRASAARRQAQLVRYKTTSSKCRNLLVYNTQ